MMSQEEVVVTAILLLNRSERDYHYPFKAFRFL
jgi:hypothetical protein